MFDSVLVNTPISSPLHAQLNLPLLKGYLGEHGFKAKVLDTNITFFHEFLGDDVPRIGRQECDDNPISLLDYYNRLEDRLLENSRSFEDLHVGLRSLAMKFDRLYFESVLESLSGRNANPFTDFYERIVEQDIKPTGASIVGIAITFQDQIISAFTLARVLRERMPDVRIVLGGQMISRCYDSMIKHDGLSQYYDYLALWDGEVPFLNIHLRELRGEDADLTNVIVSGDDDALVDRKGAALSSTEVPKADFSDIDFDAYLFPEYLVPIQTTRGCYAKCAFCAIPFGSNSYRVRDAERVVEEIEEIQLLTQSRHGHKATYFKFMEDTSSPSLLLAVSDVIAERGLDVKWETFARLEKAFAKTGFMKRLYDGGCRKIHWGLETNDPDVLKNMNKMTEQSYTDQILRLSGEAGILNFCFILIGFPGETAEQRENLGRYVIENPYIHTLTLATFDLTRNSPMEQEFTADNPYGLDCAPAHDFQVRLPYTVDGTEWKPHIVPVAHQMMIDIVRERPDIGFVTLFPDQIRGMFCDKYGNDWGRRFVERYGEDNIREMLANTETYVRNYDNKREIDIAALPEPLKREHFRTKEDMALLARAVLRRREYEQRRFEQV
jgi:hypothetical protein